MAHEKIQKGRHSELTAMSALVANGWEVSDPVVDEVYDLVAKDPADGAWKQIQVKSARIRQDRDNAVVIHATKRNGEAYAPTDCDLIMGVLADGTVYIFENRGLKEYWAMESTIAKWTKLSTEIPQISVTRATASV